MLYVMGFCAMSAAVSFVMTNVIRNTALKNNIVDIPNARSSHTSPTPRGGGLAFALSFAVFAAIDTFFAKRFFPPQAMTVLTLLLPLVILGAVDDKHGLSPFVRLPVHLFVGLGACLAFGPVPLPFSHNLGTAGAAINWGVSILGVAALINFYNFMDGLDALVAGCTFIQLLFFTFMADQLLWLLLAAGIAGFIPWNWPRASIFMGDAASTMLGGAAAIAILAAAPSAQSAFVASAVTFPLTIDATYTVCRRLLRGENIARAHRSHVYQRLNNTAGWSHSRVTITYCLLTLTFAALSGLFGAYGTLASAVIVIILIPVAERHILNTSRKLQ